MSDVDLDEILNKLGNWGASQKQYYLLLCVVVIFSVFPMSFIFTSRDIKYRCAVNECENASQTTYFTEWLKKSVPFKEDIPERCLRYTSNSTSNNNNCSNFYKNTTVQCDSFVFERQEITIVQDFNIYCDNNLWMLTLAGTLNVVGELVCLPFAGFISDRFGRKSMMVISMLCSAFIGTIRSFSINYFMYVSLEFLDTALGAGMYGGAFILAMELLSKEARNLGNTLICCAFSLGQIILGLIAWASPSWRVLLRIIYVPGLLSVALWWLIPESVRWLLQNKKQKEAKYILEQVAKRNRKSLPDGVLEKLLVSEASAEECGVIKTTETVIHSFKSITLILRAVACSFIWLSVSFVYYGLTLQSVSFSEHVYVGFILSALIEIPAYILIHFLMNCIGRKKIICTALIFGGISCVSVNLVPKELSSVAITCYLIGKFCLTIGYTVLYVYTTELFPTTSRHSMFAVCSTFGKVGAMVAPQIPLLTRISKSLPLIMFGIMAVSSGFVALLLPETFNIKLPDTVHEAKNISNCRSSNKKTPKIQIENCQL